MSEENSLDDFFANKDKTKKKSTKSTNKPSDIEQSSKSVPKVKKASKTKRKDEETSQTTKKVVEVRVPFHFDKRTYVSLECQTNVL